MRLAVKWAKNVAVRRKKLENSNKTNCKMLTKDVNVKQCQPQK